MQPFDALTMRAVLIEARAVLLNRRIEKIQQMSRDEVLLSLRSKSGTAHLLVSAQASFGRLCLVLNPPAPRSTNPPPFCQLLRKHLFSAYLSDMEQLPGERVADLSFSCVDELGNRFTRILTAEIMGRHSNLVLWDKDSKRILGASHIVTSEMSRQREIAPGLEYQRPPKQDKPNIFFLAKDDWQKAFADLCQTVSSQDESSQKEQVSVAETPKTLESWLTFTFAGLGRHLAEELVDLSQLPSDVRVGSFDADAGQALWQAVERVQNVSEFKPSMRLDLSKFSVLSFWKESATAQAEQANWKDFPSANDMVDAYFRGVQVRTEIQQLKDRIRVELKSEQEKLQQRLDAAAKLLGDAQDHDRFRRYADMILSFASSINPGQSVLNCNDLYAENGGTLAIELNPNMSASQNAQHYYRLFAKSRTRSRTAHSTKSDADEKLAEVLGYSRKLESADTMQELQVLKEKVLDRGRKPEAPKPAATQARSERPPLQRLMSTRSSDGFTILVGRNKQENDLMISKLTQPHDIWLHAQGLEGAHVLIKLPNKKDPPQTTLNEAAQVAARFARSGLGGKIRVVYTYGKHVRKLGKDKPGLVRYENERILEVDTTAPMPNSVRKLFS